MNMVTRKQNISKTNINKLMYYEQLLLFEMVSRDKLLAKELKI